MADLPSRLDYFALGRDFVKSRAKKIDPVQVDVEGSDINLFVGVASVLAAAVTRQLAFRTAVLLLDGAEGEDLDRLAYDRYGLTRKGASPALDMVRFYRVAATAGAGAVPAGTVLTTRTGPQYVTTTDATFGPTDLDNVTAQVRAVVAGKATQVGANQIRGFQNAGVLFDPTLNVNNDVASAGGEDVEDDDVFKARVRNFWTTARRGTVGAIEFGALTVPGVVSAQAFEVLNVINGQPSRVVNLYIADSSGMSNASLANSVQAALFEYRAAGIAAVISTSTPQIVSIALRLKFRANVDTLGLSNTIRAAVVEFVNSLPVNGTLYQSALGAVLQRYTQYGLIVDAGTVTMPIGDLVPDVGWTLRMLPANVTISG